VLLMSTFGRWPRARPFGGGLAGCDLRHECAITQISEAEHGIFGIKPERYMIRFGWRAHASRRSRLKDEADLLGPEVILGHIGKSAKGTTISGGREMPSGFLKHLTMQCRDGAFTGINSATGQLQIQPTLCFALCGDQHAARSGQDRIDTATDGVSLPAPGAFAYS